MAFKMMLSAVALATTLAAGANAATVFSSGFENSTFTGGSFQTAAGGSSLGDGWTVTGHSVDVINSYWPAQAGNTSIDLSGNGPGGVVTTINGLVANALYTVEFWLGANGDGDPATKSVSVSFGGNSQTVTNGPKGNGPFWTLYSLVFTATGSSQVLSFASLDAGSYGAALDTVSVSSVPLPAGGLLLLTGLGGLVAARRRKA